MTAWENCPVGSEVCIEPSDTYRPSVYQGLRWCKAKTVIGLEVIFLSAIKQVLLIHAWNRNSGHFPNKYWSLEHVRLFGGNWKTFTDIAQFCYTSKFVKVWSRAERFFSNKEAGQSVFFVSLQSRRTRGGFLHKNASHFEKPELQNVTKMLSSNS